MPNPWVPLRRDQLIPVNKAVNEKEQLQKGLEEEEEKRAWRNAALRAEDRGFDSCRDASFLALRCTMQYC
jgi:hypothetical protein